MKRLNIFIDETGTFNDATSDLFGVSFVFHEHSKKITKDINYLNNNLNKIGYDGMIHTAYLVTNRDEYKHYNLYTRRKIFDLLYKFSRKVDIKYHTIIINKKYEKCTKKSLVNKITTELRNLIITNNKYFNKFDSIVVYYDNGQEDLATILDIVFGELKGYNHVKVFDKKEKRLFQVTDMLTFVDKLYYKRINNIKYSKNELLFFESINLNSIFKSINSKRL